jgi:hypothetical protein
MDKKCMIKIVKENVWNFVKDTVRKNVAKLWCNLLLKNMQKSC